ncbi:MAG TPA: hydroxymethylglutaryl-CoA reductase [Bacillota bacterium]|nr:hydroxymethylglutaryl-CoA reductase [Bacillota bacterium]
MPTAASKALAFLLQHHLSGAAVDTAAQRLRSTDVPPAPRVPGGARLSPEVLEKRWALLPTQAQARAMLADPQTVAQMEAYQHNIENFIGTVKVPVGLAGPLRINGLFARGDFYLPLATTEAALVASCSRGARVISEAGGCAAMLVNEGVSRAPGFAFHTLEEAGRFVVWALSQQEAFRQAAEATTDHGRLTDFRFAIEGNHVYLTFEFATGSAAGQNMVTIATQAICDFIREHTPVQPHYYFVEANLSGDKKASALSFLSVRGKKVAAEVRLTAELVKRFLHSTPEMMVNYWRMSALGGVMSGTIGVHGHYANGLAALFIACGQDAACVAESAVGITRFEVTGEGGLYASVTLPNIIVGTVGGGTALPSQRACLEVLGLAGPDHAEALAEVCAGLALAGELSIIGALSSHEFTRAHSRLARGRQTANPSAAD